MAANVGVFLVTNQLGGRAAASPAARSTRWATHLSLFGPAVADGDYYRLITAAFIHFGLLHLAFNMYALYLIGRPLERYLGSVRFAVIYLLSRWPGSFGALLVSPERAHGRRLGRDLRPDGRACSCSSASAASPCWAARSAA